MWIDIYNSQKNYVASTNEGVNGVLTIMKIEGLEECYTNYTITGQDMGMFRNTLSDIKALAKKERDRKAA